MQDGWRRIVQSLLAAVAAITGCYLVAVAWGNQGVQPVAQVEAQRHQSEAWPG